MDLLSRLKLCFNRFDAMAEQMRGAVLDNTFMGELCKVQRKGPNRKIYRVPDNIEKFNIEVGKG